MRKIGLPLFLLVISPFSFAETESSRLVLDIIGFQVTARQWVSTKSALVKVTIDATLSNTDLIKARTEIMSQLNQIAKGEWQITDFNRSQDSSGLEKLVVQARSRVDESVLPNVYKNAKSISKPGMNYSIAAIEFKPSVEEVQQAKNQLRETLYNQASQEMTRINKVYPGQSYSMYNMMFLDGSDILPQPAFKERAMINTMAMQAAAPELSVSNELTMTAIVQVASNRKQES